MTNTTSKEILVDPKVVQKLGSLEEEGKHPVGRLLRTKSGMPMIHAIDGNAYTPVVSRRGNLFWRRLRFDTRQAFYSPAQKDRLRRYREVSLKAVGKGGLHPVTLSTGEVVNAPALASEVQRGMKGWKSGEEHRSIYAEKVEAKNNMLAKSLETPLEQAIVEGGEEEEAKESNPKAQPPVFLLDRISEFALALKGR